jgi:DNA-directed RNA polymerase subunit RPC12/RpoP
MKEQIDHDYDIQIKMYFRCRHCGFNSPMLVPMAKAMEAVGEEGAYCEDCGMHQWVPLDEGNNFIGGS